MVIAITVSDVTFIDVDITQIVTVNGCIAKKMTMPMTMTLTITMTVTLDSQVNMEVDITPE